MKPPYCYLSHSGRVILLVACCLVVINGIMPSWNSQAASSSSTIIRVNTTSDELNEDGDCSLREAILAANDDTAVDTCPAGDGHDTIILPVGIYTITIAGINEDNTRSGDLDITGNLTIVGASKHDTIIDGNQIDRIFEVIGIYTLQLQTLTLRNGYLPAGGLDGGGAILNHSEAVLDLYQVEIRNNTTEINGGAINNMGNAHLNYVTLESNQSNPNGVGGAIYNPGNLVIENTLFYNNEAEAENESSIDYGGGLFNDKVVILINVTFSHNSAEWGGALFNQGEVANLYNVTFTDNTTAIHNAYDLEITNSIVANSTAGENCAGNGVITSLGNNIDSGTSCDFDLESIDPLLGPLTDNLGPTHTHALLADSPAIDQGDNNDCPGIDQRGMLRPADGNLDGTSTCDIGAFEYLAVFPKIVYLPILRK